MATTATGKATSAHPKASAVRTSLPPPESAHKQYTNRYRIIRTNIPYTQALTTSAYLREVAAAIVVALELVLSQEHVAELRLHDRSAQTRPSSGALAAAHLEGLVTRQQPTAQPRPTAPR